MLTRDEILCATDLPTEELDVPEWSGVVLLKPMTAVERQGLESECAARDGKAIANFREKLAVRCIVGDDGERLFTDDDIPLLAGKSGAAMSRVADACMRINGMRDEDIDDIEGN